ncbi:hypothetical protein R3P38DRAFT_2899561 [Favolaschia claudopus]|uniref:F-box domain-containing protein n=1 Tax=Favolaschia claudopus TaxID=2862362 RepID=A0AAW0CKD7_9AGAR
MPPELEALHVQIARLDHEIGLQREVLRKLEQEKSLCKRRINDALDPISRLPREISSEIFLQTLDSIPEPGAYQPPIQLVSICNTWADIVLATPYFWSNIRIDFTRTWDQKQLLPIWLQRAGGHPLSIWLEGLADHGVMAIIWEHAHHLKHLDIFLYEPIHHPREDDKMDLWRTGSSPGPLLSLETLTIRGPENGNPIIPISSPHLLELFGLAPNLVGCRFERARISTIPAPSSEGYTVLPSLRRLTIGEAGRPPNGYEDALLKYLSLPSLEVLSTSLYSTYAEDLMSFIQRSTPPLSSLAMWANLSIPELVACLGHLPNLARLELWHVGKRAEGFLTAILQSLSLVPHLADLFIHFEPWTMDFVPFWNGLLTVLSALRHKLRAFQLEIAQWRPELTPGPDVLSALEDFAMDGFKIQITGVGSAPGNIWREHRISLADFPRTSEN